MRLKRNQLLNLILSLYITICIAILYFDLGGTKVGQSFTALISSIVPSIIPTAAITQTPDSSALILSFSWIMVILVTMAMISIANWKVIDYEAFYKKTSRWIILGIYIGIPILMLSMMYLVPNNSGASNRFLSSNLKEFKLFIILYGAGLWLSIAAGWFSIVFISICLYAKKTDSNRNK